MRRVQGTGCPPRARPAPRVADRVEGSACGRPPTPARVAPAGAGHNGPAGRAHWPRPGCGKGKRNGERAEGEGGMGGPAAARAGGRGSEPRSAASPPQTQQRREGNPGRALPGCLGARAGGGGRFAPRSGREAPSWGGGGPPVRPTRGRAPSPPRPASPAPHDRGSPAGPRLPHWRRQRRRWKAQEAEGGRGRGKGESWVRVCFVLPGWRRPRPRGRTSGRASGVPRPRSGRRGAALAGSLPAPRPGLSRSASPSSSRPPARSRSLD